LTRLPRPAPALAWLLCAAALPAALWGVAPAFGLAALIADAGILAAFLIDARRGTHRAAAIRRVHAERAVRGRALRIRTEVTAQAHAAHVRVIHRFPEGFEPREVRVDLHAGAASTAFHEAEVVPARRGSFALPAPFCQRGTPLGLGWLPAASSAPETIDVLPDVRLIGRFDALLRQRRLHEMGVIASRQRGEGTEIVGLRPYASGDPYGRLDWKASARRGAPISRQMAAERRQDVVIVLDCGRRMAREVRGQSRLDLAVEAAMLLGHVALRGDDRVGFVAFADRVQQAVAPGRGRAQARTIARAAFALQPTLREPPYRMVAARLARFVRRRALVVLFTDAAEPESLHGLAGAFRLLARRHLVLCVVFRDLAVEAALAAPPREAADLYRAGAAADLSIEREAALRALTGAGLLVLQAPAAELPAAVINRYLEVKARRLL